MNKEEVYKIAEDNGYDVNEKNVDRILKAKDMFFKDSDTHLCPCCQDGKHACLSDACREDIKKKGKCCCNLFLRRD